MLPYYPPIKFDLGFATIHGFAILVVTGVVLGGRLAIHRAAELGIEREEGESLVRWAVGVGFLFAHVFEIVFYQTHRLSEEGPLLLLKIWDGISSYGGFFGAILGMWILWTIKGRHRPFTDYLDPTVQGLTLGWVFGRLGCTTAHDHPGLRTDFFLAFDYAGGARHNLGFYEFLYTLFFMLPIMFWMHSKWKTRRGLYTAVLPLLYTPVRFFLDFLRAEDISGGDIRYFGLTPAQYFCIASFLVAFGLLLKVLKNSEGNIA